MDQKGKNRMTVTVEGLSEALVTQAIEAVVAEKGADYVYPGSDTGSCWYARQDDDNNLVPSCIVGHVLHRLGFNLTYLHDTYEGTRFVGLGTYGVYTDTTYQSIPEHVAIALSDAQSKQDNGETWGEALAAYKNSLNNHNNETENN